MMVSNYETTEDDPLCQNMASEITPFALQAGEQRKRKCLSLTHESAMPYG